MSLNSELVDRWRGLAHQAKRERRPLWVSPVQRDELDRLGGITIRRHDDGTETLFGVPIEVSRERWPSPRTRAPREAGRQPTAE